ncbi:Vms1/Ankzf1 family peptidyl-tRNA hydrolase [Chloroflexota bacterium]
MLIARRFHLRRGKMIAFLDKLKESDDVAKSLYIPVGLSRQQIDDLVEKADPGNTHAEVSELAYGSKTGALVFWSKSHRYLITPPFPVVQEYFGHGFVVKPMRALLGHDFRIALVLVRLGAYAIGFYQGESLIASKVGTGNIHSRHRQGGSSQMRFQRHRDKQIESFLTRVCGHIQDIFRMEAESVDYIVCGGSQIAVLLLRKRCTFLRQFDDRNLLELYDIAEPSQLVLEKAVGHIWSSSVIEWHDDIEI